MQVTEIECTIAGSMAKQITGQCLGKKESTYAFHHTEKSSSRHNTNAKEV
jgi:hypothetical protein